MKFIKSALFPALLLSFCSVNAQEMEDRWDVSDGAILNGKTIVKANLLGWTTRNFGFYGEHIVHKNISIVLGVNFMPTGTIPYIGKFTNERSILDVRANSFSVTPEMRFYLSNSGYGKGFYVAPYYKYERFRADNFIMEYNDNQNKKQHFGLVGSLNTHSFGAAMGVQWFVGKRKNIAIDWTIIGAHYGSNKGLFEGNSSRTLSEQEQAELKRGIEEVFKDFKIGGKEIMKIDNLNIDSNSAKAEVRSPWTLFRMALSIGYRF